MCHIYVSGTPVPVDNHHQDVLKNNINKKAAEDGQ
jgi:hypothetical protein